MTPRAGAASAKRIRSLLIALAAGSLLTSAAVAQVVLRPDEASRDGDVVSVGAEGVGVRGGSGQVDLIPWDRVEAVRGGMQDSAMEYAPLSESLWRARRRLSRGDAPGAEPLFERAARGRGAAVGPTSGLIYEGLARCRLERGARTGALDAWVLMISSGSMPRVAQRDEPAFSSPDQICPELPPMWLPTDATRVFSQSSGPEGLGIESISGRAAAIWKLYRAAAADEFAEPAELPPLAAGADPGWTFIDLCVRSRAGTDAERAQSRKGLTAMLDSSSGGWREAWIRAAVGRSLIREASPEEKLSGVAELMHLPARLWRQSPYLTGVVMRDAAQALLDLGLHAEAGRVRDDLARLLPGHPALQLPPLNAMPAAGATH